MAKRKTLRIRQLEDSGIYPSEVAYPQGVVQQNIIVPSTKDFDEKISKKEMEGRVREVSTFLSERFGGFTRYNTVGGWSSDQGLVEEPGTQVISYSNAESWNLKNRRDVVKFLRDKACKWGQEAVAYEVEGDLFFVKPRDNCRIKK